MPSQKRPRLKNLELSDPRFESGGLRLVTITTPNLRGRGDITVFVPEAARALRSAPLVILLHGIYGSHWGWAWRGGAHRTATRLIARGAIPPMLIAMPSDGLAGEGSGYVPHGKGAPDFERWITEDVPAAVALAESCVDARSPLFLAGLSMGGFGALRLAGKHPGRFLAASGLSSVTHLDQLAQFLPEPFARAGVQERDKCVLTTLKRNRRQLPPFRFDCGTEDSLLEANRALHRALEAASIPHVYQEFPGGHSWPYWEKHLVDTLRFFAMHLAEP